MEQPKTTAVIDDDPVIPLPQLTVEQVTAHSPEELELLMPNLELCECGRDEFYDNYASVLAPETDRLFPVATKIRPRILVAFQSIREMQLHSSGLVGNHVGARLPGYVEHVLYLCFQHDLAHDTKDDCSPEEVELALTKMEKQFNSNEWGIDAECQNSGMKQARSQFMSALNDLQSVLDERGLNYLRSELLTYMRGWLFATEADRRWSEAKKRSLHWCLLNIYDFRDN